MCPCVCVSKRWPGNYDQISSKIFPYFYVCPSVCVSSLKEMIIIGPFLGLPLLYLCPCVRVSVRRVLKRCLGNYDQTTSRSFFTLCVSVCLCVQSKRDGQEIMARLFLRSFLILSVSVCLCVQGKRDGYEIMSRVLPKV